MAFSRPGRGFNTFVSFGDVAATPTVVNEGTITVAAPPNFRSVVNVRLNQATGIPTVSSTFRYTDTPDFERVLLPVYARPTSGLGGTTFETFFSIWGVSGQATSVYGIAFPCNIINIGLCGSPPWVPRIFVPRTAAPLSNESVSYFELYGAPGAFLWIPPNSINNLAMSLRVRERSRQGETWGTNISIIPEREFKTDLVALLSVPLMPEFRTRLRIYSLDNGVMVRVRVIKSDSTRVYQDVTVPLSDSTSAFLPTYAEISQFNAADNVRIEVEPLGGKRIWAFASVTHNETQHITVITPR